MMRHLLMTCGLAILWGTTPTLFAQSANPDLSNPLVVLEQAARALPLQSGEPPADPPQAGFSSTISIVLLLTVLTIAPSILILCTSFTRIVIVLALLRQAVGTQSLPPSQVIVGLALFMTLLVMAPTIERINREAIVPLNQGEIDQTQAWSRAKQPVRDFMFDQIEHARSEGDLYMILNYRGIDTSDPGKLTREDVDMLTLIPAFILSELKIAFLMGFRLYLPFLIIDMVIASVLISMGMMMLPPVLISLPFKLLMFVLVDGWRLVAGNLLSSFA
jgi:flagellar biosynthetic protein FliP